MDLYIMRHGPAIDRGDPDCPQEADRHLTPDGIKKTRRAARGLAGLGIKPEVLISSPWLRAMQTAEIAAQALGRPAREIKRTPLLLPDGDPEEFFQWLAGMRAGSAICFGHGPNVDGLIAASAGASGAFTEMKKAGLAWLRMSSLVPPQGELRLLLGPKALGRLG